MRMASTPKHVEEVFCISDLDQTTELAPSLIPSKYLFRNVLYGEVWIVASEQERTSNSGLLSHVKVVSTKTI